MDMFILAMLVAVGAYALKSKDERQRITLLASHLGKYQIEKLMETLTGGYMRAIGENDPERREQIWNQMRLSETMLCEQFNNFVVSFSKVDEAAARVSKLPVGLPYAAQIFPALTFDMRQALVIHALGITNAVNNSDGQSAKSRAFTLSAEMLLMQHTCHWYCKSRTVASARVLVRHQTSYEQLLSSVSPATRRAYMELTGR